MNRLNCIIFLIACLLSTDAFGQTGEVRGFAYDKDNGEPLIFSTVFIQELMVGRTTDMNGFFALTKIKPGLYTLKCVAIGYDTAIAKIEIVAGKILNQNLFAKKSTIKLEEAKIIGQRQKDKNEVKISVNTITQKELKMLPAFGGEPDLAQYLQVLPGVVFSGDQGGQLYIRGGTPVHNKILLDGMTIYNPFHSIGLFSVFDADIIRSADVYAGGFGAQYGGRIGAVIDVNTREGNKTQFSGKVNVSPITGKVLLEGPISKFTEDGGSSSVIFSYKTSYLDRTAPALYSYAGKDGLPFSFTDVYGKTSFISGGGSKLNLFGFNFNDQVKFPQTSYAWNSSGFGANFYIVPEGSTLINGAATYSGYKMEQKEADGLPRESSINGFNINVNFTYFSGKDDVKYGIELNGFTTDFKYVNPFGYGLEQTDYTTEISGYVRYKKSIGRFLIEPGIRIQAYVSLSEISPEPRLALKYNVTDKIRFKAAAGFYSQNLLAAVSDQDVVNLFYGFLSGPDVLPRTFSGEPVESRLQKAWHSGAGFEFDLGKHQQINIEGYYKKFTQLTNINRDKIYNTSQIDKPEFQRLDFIVEDGSSYGMDFKYTYEFKKIYFWAVYSLTFVERFDGRRSYFPHFDRRHNVNLVLTYSFDKERSWNLNARWNFGSGFPFTQTQGYYERLDVSRGLNNDYLNQNGNLGFYFTDINSGRLPTFHRLDVSLSKKMNFSKSKSLTATVGATNVYNRENIFYFDRSRFTRINQLPIIPTLGINYSF
ncbi:MAG: TonB-dependent receptor [Bacteroidia bacterium]|nr:TonB-dependent receptor [Bacteroidia bacterium]